ncbi:MAG: cysteine hydrolase [Chloroflexi bacterium]|nr:cysteine hydrolase [Chloroflexota bacterium]
MQPPVAIQDRGEYKRGMKELLTIDPKKTVVLTVDMQRDYLDMEIGTSPVAPDESERVISHARELLAFARAEGIPVIHTYVKRRPIEVDRGFLTSVFGEVSRANRLSQNAQAPARKGADRVAGTQQAEVPEVLVEPGDVHVTTKRVMDSYLGTDLERLLSKVFKAETVILTGINTDTCVYATTFGTVNRGFKAVVISDCVASMRGKDHHWMALELMSRSIAWVLTVDEFKAKVEATKSAVPVTVGAR